MANSVGRFPPGSSVPPHQVYRYQKNNSSSPSEELGTQSRKRPNPPRRPKRLPPFIRGLLWGATVSVTAALSATIGATFALVTPSSPTQLMNLVRNNSWTWTQDESEFHEKGAGLLPSYQLSQPINILVMGVDRVPDAEKGTAAVFGGHSDTLLLVRFNPDDRSVRLLSIPRDSRVEIPGVGFTKINDANLVGGSALAARVVSKTLNDVPIDRYVRVTTDAFKELVDLVGGVEVFVPHSMSYRDVTQNLEINLKAGWQTLNGEQAEQFSRFRSDRYGDIGRVQRQQILMKALQKRLYSPAMLPRLPQAMRILQQYVDTNLSLEEILALANFGRELERENIKMVMLPGRFSQKEEFDARSYWIISETGVDRIMLDYFDRAPNSAIGLPDRRRTKRVRIAIQNATDDPALTQRVREYLTKQDFNNIYEIQDSPQLLAETEIIVQKGDLESANNLKNTLGLGRVEASSIGDLDSDLTIRIGIDAKDLLAGDSFLKNDGRLSQTLR